MLLFSKGETFKHLRKKGSAPNPDTHNPFIQTEKCDGDAVAAWAL